MGKIIELNKEDIEVFEKGDEKHIFAKVKSKKKKDKEDIYDIFIIYKDGQFIDDKQSCTCLDGSFYGESKKNKEKECNHIKLLKYYYLNHWEEENEM